MPQEGAAAIEIDDQDITYTNITGASINAQRIDGFTMLAQDFTTTPGKERLVAANSTIFPSFAPQESPALATFSDQVHAMLY